ncbi:oligosaccharide flippase family protein [bacterium]|nr:oligosaccharide flippase family protein [bacterium]
MSEPTVTASDTRSSSLGASVKRSALHVTAGMLLSKAVAMFLSWYLVRKLSMEDFGRYNLILSSLVYLVFLSNLGTQSTLQRFIPEYFARRQFRRISKTYRMIAVLNLAMAILVFAVLLAFYRTIAGLVNMAEYREVFFVFAIAAVLFFQINIIGIVLNNLFLHVYQVWGQLACITLKTAFIVVFLEKGYGLRELFVAEVFAYTPALLALFYLYRRWIAPRIRAADTGEQEDIEYRRFARYSGYNLVTLPHGIAMDFSLANLVVSRYLDFAQLGAYAFAYRVSQMILQVLPQRLLQSVIRPAFYTRFSKAEDKNRALHEMFNTLCRFNLFFLLPSLAFVLLGGKHIILHVFGEPQYLGAYPVLAVTFAFLCTSFFELPADLTIQALEKLFYRFLAQYFTFFGLVLSLALVWTGYGIMGVAVATGLSAFCKNLFLYYFARRHTGMRFEWRATAPLVVNTLVMALPMWLILRWGDNLAGLALAWLAGSATYLLVTWLNSPFSLQEREQFRRMLHRRR